jgi:hypothetical protein
MSTHPTLKVLDTEIRRGRQDVHYHEVVQVGPHTCHIHIRSDAYRQQCFAIARMWSRTKPHWNEAASIHYAQMSTEEGLAYSAHEVNASHFRADRTVLVERLATLLGGDSTDGT